MAEFVKGWFLGPILGEGAYGEVKLLVNKNTNEEVAVKMIDLKKHPEARHSTVSKESVIHRMLQHPNIIRYYGQRSEPKMEYIFLEYASGGELFEKIEPDVGMPVWEAHKYFIQLISAIEYMHGRGIAHRDLKPENLLLDSNDNLKVSDFGMATVYRMNGKERQMRKRCGSMPYVAPEVFRKSREGLREETIIPYDAAPVDVWSCGIILVAFLTGELPWDRAQIPCEEYVAWTEGGYIDYSPWKKFDKCSFSLIRKILHPFPATRFKIDDIKSHRWYLQSITNEGLKENKDNVDGPPLKSLHYDDECLGRNSFSQPQYPGSANDTSLHVNMNQRAGFSFSQPAALGDLLVQSQPIQNTQSDTVFQKLVKRMTRFFVETNCDETVKRLINSLETLNYTCRINESGVVTVTTVDRLNMPLVFKALMIEMDGKILVDFRLSKGCGLEFKRRFLKIKDNLHDIIMKGPVTWSVAVATKSMP